MRHYGYCNRRVGFDYGSKAAVLVRSKLHPRASITGAFDMVGYWSGGDATAQFLIYPGYMAWNNDEFDGGTPPYGESYSAAPVLGCSTNIPNNRFGAGSNYEWRVAAIISGPDVQALETGNKWYAPKPSAGAQIQTTAPLPSLVQTQFLLQVRKKGTTEVLDTFFIYMKAESF